MRALEPAHRQQNLAWKVLTKGKIYPGNLQNRNKGVIITFPNKGQGASSSVIIEGLQKNKKKWEVGNTPNFFFLDGESNGAFH